MKSVSGFHAVFIGTGILVSYYGLLLIASWIRARLLKREAGQNMAARDPWNRSMRDTPYKPGEHQSDPVERLFVATAIGLIWAAFDGRKQGWHDKIANTVVLQG